MSNDFPFVKMKSWLIVQNNQPVSVVFGDERSAVYFIQVQQRSYPGSWQHYQIDGWKLPEANETVQSGKLRVVIPKWSDPNVAG